MAVGTAYSWDNGTTGTGTTPWSYWNTTTSATTSVTWSNWTTSAGTTTATYDTVWYYWTNDDGLGFVNDKPQRHQPTPEEQQRMEEARQRAEREALERKQQADEERKRAKELLAAHLDEEQKKQLAAKGEFEVESQSGKRYVIKRGSAGNVFSLDARRRRVKSHCIHPADYLPDEDVMLAQMLWLKWNEEAFMKVANHTTLIAA